MSGHSKWASIKHKKAKEDAKRGQIFTKVIKEITIAARMGGGVIEANARLKSAINAAKAVNMPWDNIERAIKRGTGELEGMAYEEVYYEGYGPDGVGVLIEAMTDNKNRTTSEIRKIFSKNGGNLGEKGCVSWMFETRGVVYVSSEGISEDKLLELIIEVGALDLTKTDGDFEIITEPEHLEDVVEFLKKKNINISASKITKVPKSFVKLEGHKAEQMLRLIESLEDHDDIKNTWANFDIDDSIIESFMQNN